MALQKRNVVRRLISNPKASMRLARIKTNRTRRQISTAISNSVPSKRILRLGATAAILGLAACKEVTSGERGLLKEAKLAAYTVSTKANWNIRQVIPEYELNQIENAKTAEEKIYLIENLPVKTVKVINNLIEEEIATNPKISELKSDLKNTKIYCVAAFLIAFALGMSAETRRKS